jgi:uncharacterized protein (TIGR01244 family)
MTATLDLKKISESVSVTGQISGDDIEAIKASGFGTIICNRPDGEEPGQPSFADIRAAAMAEGLRVIAIPVGASGASETDVVAFADALDTAKDPVLAYCRSGMRSTTLWALTQAGHIPSDQIIAKAKGAGYDLTPLAARLRG